MHYGSHICNTMSTISKTMTFSAREHECEILFCRKGPFYHLYTDGNSSEILFSSKEDFIFMMNLIGVCSCHFKDVYIYAFAIMNNHLHFILECQRQQAEEFFEMIKGRLKRFYIRNSRYVNLKNFKCNFIQVDNLNSLRNEIAYVNRNGYLVRPDCTPFSYPWGTGAWFFNPVCKLIPSCGFKSLSSKNKRGICHSHNIHFDSDNLTVYEGIILPSSFCCIAEAESMFRNAHHYFHMISKNFEAYSEIAHKLHEKVIFSDEEMYAVVSYITYKQFNTKQPSLLAAKEKIEMAKRMHYEFNASNRQIKNILKLDIGTIDELFPK